MAGINGVGNTFYSPEVVDEPEVKNNLSQMTPARGPALPTQQVVQSEAMAEAIESMSLVMGTRLRQHERRGDGKSQLHELAEKMSAWVPKVAGTAMAELMSQFSNLGSGEHSPLEVLNHSGLEPGAMALLLAGLLREKGMHSSRRRKLENALETLLADDSLGIDIFAWLELDGIEKHNLLPVKMLYERSRGGEDSPESLLEWYEEVCDWEDRDKRLKILIQALALDLQYNADHSQFPRIVNSIKEIKRLLLFFNLSENSLWISKAGDISRDAALKEILNILGQVWIYSDWIIDRLNYYRFSLKQKILWVSAVLEFINSLPDMVFRDDDQQKQICDVLEELQDKFADEEALCNE